MSARRLIDAYRGAPLAAIEDGRAWYPTAAREAARIARPTDGIDVVRAAAVIAALSPQVRWAQNVVAAERLIAARGGLSDSTVPGFNANVAKARAIIRGGPLYGPGDALGGEAPKVRAFWRAICGDPDSVVLDVWAMRAAGLDGAPSGARYRKVAEMYRRAAAKVGEAPRDFQAIVWLATRGLVEHARDRSVLDQLSLFKPGNPELWAE